MIYDLKDRSRKDLIETVNIQAEEYKKLLAENKELEQNLGLSRIALDHQKTLDALIETFIESKAENYLSLIFERDGVDMYEVVIRKIDGMTPAEKNLALEQKIAELEKERDALLSHIFRMTVFVTRSVEKLKGIPEFEPTANVLNRVLLWTPTQSLEAHNLEQQAKILNELAIEAYADTKDGCAYQMLLIQKARALTEQAKQLREGKK